MTADKGFRLPCGHFADDASVTDDPTMPCAREGGPMPEAGNVSVCFSCAAVGIFTGEGFAVRAPTDDERAEALADPEIARVVGSLLAYRAVDV